MPRKTRRTLHSSKLEREIMGMLDSKPERRRKKANLRKARRASRQQHRHTKKQVGQELFNKTASGSLAAESSNGGTLVTVMLSESPLPATVDAKDRPESEKPKFTLRGSILHEGRMITEDQRNGSYGDPLFNLGTTAALKEVFWTAFDQAKHSPEHVRIHGRNSAHGHAIDMVLTKIARLATCKDEEPHRDTYTDAAVYSAIAYEVAALEAARGKGLAASA